MVTGQACTTDWAVCGKQLGKQQAAQEVGIAGRHHAKC